MHTSTKSGERIGVPCPRAAVGTAQQREHGTRCRLRCGLVILVLHYHGQCAVVRRAPPLPHGVAAGDTTANSTVLWALTPAAGQVTFEYATDPSFATLAGSANVAATSGLVPVKTSIAGLAAGTQYHYRATDSGGNTSSGVFRTSAAPGMHAGLRFGVSGDWRGELASYPAVVNAPARNLEFFHALGDTVYADVPSPALNIPQATTLDEFRTKHREIYTERFGLNALAGLRQSTSLLATYDDHEVTDDFAGAALASSDPRFSGEPAGTLINQSTLFNNGLQVFHEYHPIRTETYGAVAETRTAGRPKFYRNNRYGDDAVVITLDARSFRDEMLPAATSPLDPTAATFKNDSYFLDRTMLGRTQLADLKQDLAAAQAAGVTWKFVMIPEPIQNLGVIEAPDRYEGYARERADVLRFIKQNQIQNVVFIAADIHGTIVNNLTYEDNAPARPRRKFKPAPSRSPPAPWPTIFRSDRPSSPRVSPPASSHPRPRRRTWRSTATARTGTSNRSSTRWCRSRATTPSAWNRRRSPASTPRSWPATTSRCTPTAGPSSTSTRLRSGSW